MRIDEYLYDLFSGACYFCMISFLAHVTFGSVSARVGSVPCRFSVGRFELASMETDPIHRRSPIAENLFLVLFSPGVQPEPVVEVFFFFLRSRRRARVIQ